MSETLTVTVPRPNLRSLAIGLSLGLVAASIASPAFAPSTALAVDPARPAEHVLSVTGSARVLVSPDIADIRLTVSRTKPTVKAARSAAAAAMTKVLAALRKLGIAEPDIETTTVSLQPVYAYGNGSKAPRLSGYSLSNAIVVTIRDLDLIGAAIDDGLAAGATILDGVTFRVDDPTRAEEQARREAVSQAKAKGETLAAGAGVSIVGIAALSETLSPVPYPAPYDGMRATAVTDLATPVRPGVDVVVVSITISYLID
jgi:uncharacterized protein YggE